MAFSEAIFPSANDVYGSGTDGDGNVLSEAFLAGKWSRHIGAAHNHKISGSAPSAPGSGLVLTVPDSEWMIAGYYVDTGGSDTVTVTDSATRYVYIELDRDGNNNVTGVSLGSTATYADAAYYADRALIGKTIASGGNITSFTDYSRGKHWVPHCVMYRTSALSIADATLTHTTVDTISQDTDNMGNTASNRIDINRSGLYAITGMFKVGSGTDYARIYGGVSVDGSVQFQTDHAIHTVSGSAHVVGVSTVLYVASGSYLQLACFQDNTASASRSLTVGAVTDNFLSATWVGARGFVAPTM